MAATSKQIGMVSVDSAEMAAEVVPGYDGAIATVAGDGAYPVFIDYDDSGSPVRLRVELTGG